MEEAQQQIEAFIKTYPVTRIGKGQTMIRPGDKIEKAHYLLEGTVIQYDISAAGNVIIVNVFQAGSLFPLPYILDNRPSDFFFEADSPVSTRVAPREHVIRLIEGNSQVALSLLKISYRGSDEILKRLSYAMGGSATDRALYELVSAAQRIGEKSIGGGVFIPLSENDIAKRTGLSRETVNRVLREFKTTGIIHATNQGIRISSLEQLRDSLNRN